MDCTLVGSFEGSLKGSETSSETQPYDGLKQLYRGAEACRKGSQKLSINSPPKGFAIEKVSGNFVKNLTLRRLR